MSCRRCSPPPGRQRGAALVIALMVFGICAALMVAMKGDFELFYQRAANTFFAEQGYTYLRGAEDLAILALVADHDIDEARELRRDDLGEIWARALPPSPLDDGIAVMSGRFPGDEAGVFRYLQDLQGRFNLNNLECQRVEPGEGEEEQERFGPHDAQFLRLLQSFEEPVLGLPEAVAVLDALCDWLDGDSVPRLYGAENDYYYGRTPAYRAPNQGSLSSVTELRAVANVTPEIYAALAPLVTVWPPEGGTLNVNTAPPAVLRSLNADGDLNPLPPELALSLAEIRDEVPFQDKGEFLAQLPFEGSQMEDLQNLLGVTSSWYRLGAAVKVADRTTHLYSVLHRSQRRVEVMARSSGEL